MSCAAFLRIGAIFLLAWAAAPSLAAAQPYRVIDLGIPSHPLSPPADINNHLQVVVGRVGLLGGFIGEPFFWDPVQGMRPLGIPTTGPIHINNQGVVAGVRIVGTGEQPFIWINGTVHQPLTPADSISDVWEFTDSGILLMQGARSWIVHGATIHDLTAMGITAFAVNDYGMVGGLLGSRPFSDASRPFLRFPDGRVITPWDAAVPVSLIGAGGHFAGTGLGLAGDYYGGPDGRVVWFPFRSPFGRVFTGINRAGDLVGFQGGRFGANSPFLYRGGQIHNLNALMQPNVCGCSLTAASATNDAGYIVATARFGSTPGEYRVVLLEPTVPAAPTGVIFDVMNRVVRLAWAPSPGAVDYILQAGTSPGLSNLFNGSIGGSPFLVTSAPPGRYYVRVLARNALGVGPPSAEVVIDVP